VTVLLWWRRDLRIHDNPALLAALEHELVIPVFCLDERLLHGRHSSPARTRFLLESLGDLAGSLRGLGSDLVIRSGDPARVLLELARQTRAVEVHASADVSPFARQRDQYVARALRAAGMELRLHPGVCVIDDVTSLLTGQGRPYTVFTPF